MWYKCNLPRFLKCLVVFLIITTAIINSILYSYNHHISNNTSDNYKPEEASMEEIIEEGRIEKEIITGIVNNSILPSKCVNPDKNYLSWTISPESCSEKTYLVWLIKSSIYRNSLRNSIRNFWGRDIDYINQNKKYTTKRIFLIGSTEEKNISSPSLEYEITEYQDILQGSFVDTLESVTKKVVLGMQFVKTRCKKVQYVVIADDDAVILPWNLFRLFPSHGLNTTHFFGGFYNHKNAPVRQPGARWFVPESDYHCILYPPYPKGTGFFMSYTTLTALYNEVIGYYLFGMDDVLFGGIALELGIKGTEVPAKHYGSCENLLTGTHKMKDVKDLIMCHAADYPKEQEFLWYEFCHTPISDKKVYPYYLQYCKRFF